MRTMTETAIVKNVKVQVTLSVAISISELLIEKPAEGGEPRPPVAEQHFTSESTLNMSTQSVAIND